MPVTWSDEKLILLYCPGRGSNSRPSAHLGFKHGQGVPRPYSLGHGGGLMSCGTRKRDRPRAHWLDDIKAMTMNYIVQQEIEMHGGKRP